MWYSYMLRAQTKSGKMVTLAMLTEKDIRHMRKQLTFYCPDCHEEVIVRAGRQVIPHFAHRMRSSCTRHTGESAQHMQGKLQLFQWLRRQYSTVQLERYLPELQQRPDIFLNIHQKRIAVEIQYSKMSWETISKRNQGYVKANITPIWVLGNTLFKRIHKYILKLDSFSLQFVHQFLPRLPTLLIYYCPHTKTFIKVSDIYMFRATQAIASISIHKSTSLTFAQLVHNTCLSPHVLFSLWRKEKRRFRLKRGSFSGVELSWQNWLYEKGYYIDYLPSIIHLPVGNQHVMKVPLWHWQSRIVIELLHSLSVDATFTLQQVQQFVLPYQEAVETYPLLSPQNPAREYLSLLEHLHIIEEVYPTIYVKRKPILFYTHIEDALNGDDEILRYFMYNNP